VSKVQIEEFDRPGREPVSSGEKDFRMVRDALGKALIAFTAWTDNIEEEVGRLEETAIYQKKNLDDQAAGVAMVLAMGAEDLNELSNRFENLAIRVNNLLENPAEEMNPDNYLTPFINRLGGKFRRYLQGKDREFRERLGPTGSPPISQREIDLATKTRCPCISCKKFRGENN